MIFPSKVQPGEHPTAAKFNDLVDFVRRIRPISGNGMRIEQTPGGSVINASTVSTVTSGGPFQLRYHIDQWEIYLPPGCVSMRETAKIINQAASASSGHENDSSHWYRLFINEEWASAGQPTFDVNIHVKPCCMRAGEDTLNAPGSCGFLASADLRGGYGSDENNARNKWGDAYCQTVGVITLPEGYSIHGNSRQCVRTVDRALQFWCPAPSNYDLLWSITDDDDSAGYEAKLDKILCLRQSSSMAGVTVVGEDMTEIALTGEHVYAVIDTTSFGATGSSVEHVVTVANAPSTSGSTLTKTNLLLYDLNNGVVTADYRASALANVQAYR